MSLFLGLDSSTQSLTAIVLDTANGQIVRELAINFGQDLPQFNSPNGFLPHANPLVKHSDPLMWVAALELVMDRLKAQGVPLAQIRGISGSGQQHGSVYLKTGLSEVTWRSDVSLVDQLRPLLSRATAPIWMDSATTAECQEIAEDLGGDEEVSRISGSRTIERFTGPQIRRFYKEDPKGYAATGRIHMVSSFVASLLIGGDAPIDFGDGAGMNLLDLAKGEWHGQLLAATAPGLAAKLPPVKPGATQAGTIAAHFVSRYGFTAGTPVFVFSGDNPSSLVGMGASEPGTAVISLGTSDTFFGAMSQPKTDPRGYGHVFGNPAGGFMSLICFKNGSLAREEILKRTGMSWEAFSNAILGMTLPGNNGNLMLPYFVPEITPVILAPEVKLSGTASFCDWRDPAALARAIVEAQALSMKLHSDWIGEGATRILATGGAARNRGILQVLADVFQAKLQRLAVGNSAALGGAVRAAQAVTGRSYADLAARFSAPDPAVVITPNAKTAPVYEAQMRKWQQFLEASFPVRR